MSIPRHALIPSITPRTSRLPHGLGLWWPLHGSFSGMPDTPAMAEIVTGTGTPIAGKWTDDALMYSLPTNNAEANAVALLASHADDELDVVLSMFGAAVDTQILIATCVRGGNQQTTAGWVHCYGISASASCYGWNITTGELPAVVGRGKNASTITTVNTSSGLTLASGTAFDNAGYRDTDLQTVIGWRVTGALAADFELHIANALLSCVYTGSMDFSLNGGDGLPGLGSASKTLHRGFFLGARGLQTGSGNFDVTLGSGAGNVSRIGNACARRFSAYDSGRAAQALADLLARPGDYPESWLL